MSSKPVNATKILIVRHAEKPDDSAQGVMPDGTQSDEALIVQGWQRSGGLIALFNPSAKTFQNPELATPGTIFASWESASKGSQRPLQTVATLAAALNLQVQTRDQKDLEGLAKAALDATGVVLISWQHEDIPSIAEEIAKEINKRTNLPMTSTPPSPWPPPKWPGKRFDLVWVFDPVGSPPTSWNFTQVPQLLLPGDLNTVVTASDDGSA